MFKTNGVLLKFEYNFTEYTMNFVDNKQFDAILHLRYSAGGYYNAFSVIIENDKIFWDGIELPTMVKDYFDRIIKNRAFL